MSEAKEKRKLWSLELTPEIDEAVEEILRFQNDVLPAALGHRTMDQITKTTVLRQLISLGIVSFWSDRTRLVGLLKLAGMPDAEQRAEELHKRSAAAQAQVGAQMREEDDAKRSDPGEGVDPVNVSAPAVVRKKRGRPAKMGAGVGTSMGKGSRR